MKKTLLISVALVISTAGFAQGSRNSATFNKPVSVKEANKPIVEAEFPTSTAKSTFNPKTISHPTSSSICTPVRFTAVVNAFAVGGGVTT